MTKIRNLTKFDVEQVVKDDAEFQYSLEQNIKSVSIRNYGNTIFYIQNIIPVLPMAEEVFKADEGCCLELTLSIRFGAKVISDENRPICIKPFNNCVLVKSFNVCQ
jgi:hypothetical protein